MNLTLVILFILIVSNIALFFILLRPKKEVENQSDGLILLQNQMQNMNKMVNDNIKEIIKDVTKLDETNRQVVSFADQLQSLQDILKNPKQRGVLGKRNYLTIGLIKF